MLRSMRCVAGALALVLLRTKSVSGEEEGKCPEKCVCGHKHPIMDEKKHPFMECAVDVQGIELKLLAPFVYEYEHPGLLEVDLAEYTEPKLLPPWGRETRPPFSLYGVQKGTVVLDIGANYGLFSLLIAKAYPDVKVVAIEPVKWMAVLLQENVRRNGLSEDQVKVVQAPLTGDGRDVTLYMHYFWQQHSNIYTPAQGGEHSSLSFTKNISMKSMTLKQVLATAGAESGQVSFAKVDCHGCEQEIMQEIPDLDISFSMECHGPMENSKYSTRQWLPVPYFTHLTEKDGSRCLEMQALGEARLLERAALAGRPAEKALIGLQHLSEGNYSYVIDMFTKSADSDTKHPQPGPAALQYEIVAEAIRSVAAFFAACALADGQGLQRDTRAAAELFAGVATSPQRLEAMEADMDILHKELPMLADAHSGSMFRLAQLLTQDGAHQEAEQWYDKAAGLGHALAQAHIVQSADRRFVGTNGQVGGHSMRQLMTMVQLEALGIPQSLHETMLGTSASGGFDACMKQDQEQSVPRWMDVFKGQGMEYDRDFGSYRFRSWLHSAMGCWLKAA